MAAQHSQNRACIPRDPRQAATQPSRASLSRMAEQAAAYRFVLSPWTRRCKPRGTWAGTCKVQADTCHQRDYRNYRRCTHPKLAVRPTRAKLDLGRADIASTIQ